MPSAPPLTITNTLGFALSSSGSVGKDDAGVTSTAAPDSSFCFFVGSSATASRLTLWAVEGEVVS